MRIFALNFNNTKLNTINFVHQNPISFSAKDKEMDSVTLSNESKAQRLILKLETENKDFRQKISEYSGQLDKGLQRQDKDAKYFCSGIYQATLTHLRTQIEKNETIIRNLKESPDFILLYDDDSKWRKATPTKKIQMAKECGLSINLDESTYDKISPSAKKALPAFMEHKKVQVGTILFNNKINREFLARFNGCHVLTFDELIDVYGIDELKSLFPNSSRVYAGKASLVLIPSDEITDKILDDLKNGKVATVSKLTRKKEFDVITLPLAFKKYSNVAQVSSSQLKADENNSDLGVNMATKLDFHFVDLEDEKTSDFLSYSAEGKKLLAQLPFEITENEFVSYIDINNPNNKNIFKDIHDIYPKKSRYCIVGNASKGYHRVEIPVSHLEELGYSNTERLITLIESGELSGKKDENGEYFILLNIDVKGKPDKDLTLLHQLRQNNPKIVKFNDFARGLKISRSTLSQAIFNGEVELIGEYINSADREIRYIDITNHKNQEFIRKIKFEKAIQITLSNLEKAELKIAKQDLKQRMAAVRMALAWEFMPNTRGIASMLAKDNEWIAEILAKNNDPNKTLTEQEEIILAKYRKELWLQAGTQELQVAHKKANAIMKTFNEYGLSAVDAQYLPIFERYGFVLA